MANAENNKETMEKANFETAISETKFGKFNFLLLVCAIPASMTPIIDNTVMSYVIPMAQCDLNMSLRQKGTLNSAVFVGYILSSYFWGFLSDNLGRKRILLVAYALDFILNFLGSFMHHFWLQYTFKFLAGFVASGPYALIITYMSEFHSTLYRSKVVMFTGLAMTTSTIVLALLAWGVMPLSNMLIFTYVLYPWQLYMLISCLATFISTIVFVFLPESPKFLMTSGNNEEAMKIFKMMYRFNTGKNEDTYSFIHPHEILVFNFFLSLIVVGTIYSLNFSIQQCFVVTNVKFQIFILSNIARIVNSYSYCTQEVKGLTNENINTINNETYSVQYMTKIFTSGFQQLKPLFHKPYVSQIFLCFVIHFGILCGANTLRLWLPQIFSSIDEYNKLFGTSNGTLCEVIEHSFGNRTSGNSTEIEAQFCQVILPENQVFINLLIVACCSLVGYCLLATIINLLPKKRLLAILVTVGGCLAFGMYWTPNQNMILVVATLYITLLNVSSTILMSLVVEVFPTTLRGVAVSLAVMSGQLGAFLGNLFFPFMLQAGCLPPFLFLGCIVTFCGLLCLTLPNPSGKDFK